MKDLHNNIEVRRAISPVSVADDTPQVSQSIDMSNRDSLEFVIAIGSVADAGVTFTVLVEESTDDSTYTAVADADLLGTESGASFQFDSDDSVRKIGYIGAEQYVRLTITPANNAFAALISAVAVLGGPRVKPRSSQSA